MNAKKCQAGLLNAAARHLRRGELLAQKAEARLESLIPDLLHLLERGLKSLETFRINRKCVQLHAESDPRRNMAALPEQARRFQLKRSPHWPQAFPTPEEPPCAFCDSVALEMPSSKSFVQGIA